MMTLFDHDETLRIFIDRKTREASAEALARGMKKGLSQGSINALISLVKDGLLSREEACRRLNMTDSELTDAISKTMQ